MSKQPDLSEAMLPRHERGKARRAVKDAMKPRAERAKSREKPDPKRKPKKVQSQAPVDLRKTRKGLKAKDERKRRGEPAPIQMDEPESPSLPAITGKRAPYKPKPRDTWEKEPVPKEWPADKPWPYDPALKPKPPSKLKRVMVYLPPETYDRLKEHAAESGYSMSTLLGMAYALSVKK